MSDKQTPRFPNAPEASELLQNRDALLRVLGSPDGRRLMTMLSQTGGNLQGAAAAAATGNTAPITSMLQKLALDPEGAALIKRITDSVKKP